MSDTESPDMDRLAEARQIAHEARQDRAEIERLRTIAADTIKFIDGHFPNTAFTEANHSATELSNRFKRALEQSQAGSKKG